MMQFDKLRIKINFLITNKTWKLMLRYFTIKQLICNSTCNQFVIKYIKYKLQSFFQSPLELRTKISDILPNLLYLDDQPLKGQPVSELATSSHKLLGNTGNLQSEIRVCCFQFLLVSLSCYLIEARETCSLRFGYVAFSCFQLL